MSDHEPKGYGHPPREHRFKPGNKAASKRNRSVKAKGKEKTIVLSDIIKRAWFTKRKVRRGENVFTVPAGEIMIERLIQTMSTGTTRDMMIVMQMVEKFCPDMLARATETLEIIYHRAASSAVAPPPDDLWDEPKP